MTSSTRELVFRYQMMDEAKALCDLLSVSSEKDACKKAVQEMPVSYDFSHEF